MNRSSKVISKYYRIRLTDKLKDVIGTLPVRNLEENQVGDHVYSGSGEIRVRGDYFPMTVKVRLVHGEPRVYIRSPRAGIAVACSFECVTVGDAVREAIKKSLN